MAKQPKTYVLERNRRGETKQLEPMTLQELVENFRYTLETGKSYEHEKGNRKINVEPKTIKSLITNVNNALNNAAANGYANHWYTLVD